MRCAKISRKEPVVVLKSGRGASNVGLLLLVLPHSRWKDDRRGFSVALGLLADVEIRGVGKESKHMSKNWNRMRHE